MLFAKVMLGVFGREPDATDGGRCEVLWEETDRKECRAGSLAFSASARALSASPESLGSGTGCEEVDEEKERNLPPAEEARPGVGMPEFLGRAGVAILYPRVTLVQRFIVASLLEVENRQLYLHGGMDARDAFMSRSSSHRVSAYCLSRFGNPTILTHTHGTIIRSPRFSA